MSTDKKCILIAESSSELQKKLRDTAIYHFEFASDGKTCLEKIQNVHPDLLIIDLLLPKIHGIEILKNLKKAPHRQKIGIIIMTGQPLIQNYYTAVDDQADYVLEKPFQTPFLLTLIEQFFLGLLKPASFKPIEKPAHPYNPQPENLNTYLKFWGTRGSNPVSGHEYVRFGGNTPCLEIRAEEDLVIIDAGTGIRALGEAYQDFPQTINLLFSHTHWDHILAFPFFKPIYNSHHEIIIWTPVNFEKKAEAIFNEMLSYAYFPVRLKDIPAKVSFKDLNEGETLSFGKIKLTTHYAYHPGSTLCFKISIANKTIGYATDNEFLIGYQGDPAHLNEQDSLLEDYRSQIHFFKGCDTLIHEAQYTPLDYQNKSGWGHSSISNATLLIKYAQIKEWIVTHHDPQHTDEDLLKKLLLHQQILKDCQVNTTCTLAFDKQVYYI
jgi:phosphoribosyl 1,2-cyclic phosphodiesterase/CheY-like chemotaxis protein